MYFNSQRTGLILAHQAWDMLVHRDPATFEIKPLLATDWKFAEDNSLDLTIRAGREVPRRQHALAPTTWSTPSTWRPIPTSKVATPSQLRLDRQGREDRRLDRAHQDEAADAGGAGIPRHGDADPSQGLSREGRAGRLRQAKPVGAGPYKIVKNEQGKEVVVRALRGLLGGLAQGQAGDQDPARALRARRSPPR